MIIARLIVSSSRHHHGSGNRRSRIRQWLDPMLAAALLVGTVWPGVASAMEFCTGRERVTCVVDGDTVWIAGEKIRLADIDAPEKDAPCAAGRILAARSAARLAELLAPGTYEIRRGDPADGRLTDRFGRTLAIILVESVSVGSTLISEGLARPWSGRRENWC